MATLTLQPDATAGLDTFIQDNAPTTNSETDTTIYVGENNGSAQITRTLIKFDLSSLPAGITVDSATLTLTITADVSSNARTFEIFEVLRAWLESPAPGNVWT